MGAVRHLRDQVVHPELRFRVDRRYDGKYYGSGEQKHREELERAVTVVAAEFCAAFDVDAEVKTEPQT